MNCVHARRLFGAYWDDEATQAEREWLESHFASCAACRAGYEGFARALELLGGLPRIEAAPGLVERALARARRASPAPDRLGVVRPRWVPVTAAAAAVMLAVTLVTTWVGLQPGGRLAERPAPGVIREPELVRRAERAAQPGAPAATPEVAALMGLAGVPADSLFDHSEDVEFILDPVTLRRSRGRAVTQLPAGVRAEQAVISF